MKNLPHNLFFLCVLVFLSCSGPLPPKQYVQWVEAAENGLKVSTQRGNYIISAQYKPSDYLALKQLKKLEINDQELNSSKLEFDDMEHFTLEISLANQRGDVLKEQIASAADYYARIRYFSFQIQENLRLSYGGQVEKPCVIHHFERNFGISPSLKIVLAFEKEDHQGDKILIYDDLALGIGRVELPIAATAIEKLPLLAVNE